MILRGCRSKQSLPARQSHSQNFSLQETEYLDCNGLSSFHHSPEPHTRLVKSKQQTPIREVISEEEDRDSSHQDTVCLDSFLQSRDTKNQPSELPSFGQSTLAKMEDLI